MLKTRPYFQQGARRNASQTGASCWLTD